MSPKPRPYPIEDDDEPEDEFAIPPSEAADSIEFASVEIDETGSNDELDGTPPSDLTADDVTDPQLSEPDALLLDKSERTWLSRLSEGVASTGRFLYDIPGNLGVTRPALPQLRGAIPDPPLGARQVSHGYADDLWQALPH